MASRRGVTLEDIIRELAYDDEATTEEEETDVVEVDIGVDFQIRAWIPMANVPQARLMHDTIKRKARDLEEYLRSVAIIREDK